jgi:undecaprenyl diphosphate synthase
MPGSSEHLLQSINRNALPAHIAVIMDGNGRWARKRGLPRVAGHRSGINAVREVVEGCAEIGISFLTLYAFSVENWKRPATEVRTLMLLLREFLNREIDNLDRNNIRLKTIGRTDQLEPAVRVNWKRRSHERPQTLE